MSHGRPLGHPGARERLMIAVSDLFCENDAVNNAIAAWHCAIFFSYMRKLRGYTVSKRMKDGLTIK